MKDCRPRLSARWTPAVHRFIPLAQAGLDMAAWTVSMFAASWIRLDFRYSLVPKASMLRFVLMAGLVQLAVGFLFGLYRRRWRYGSFEEVAALVRVSAVTTIVLFVSVANVFEPRPLPRGGVLSGGLLALVLTGGIRYAWRLGLERRRVLDQASSGGFRTLLFGAGAGGEQVLTAMRFDRSSGYIPVGILDDDAAKRRLSIKGVPVLGDRSDLERVAREQRADSLLIAVPSARADLIADLSERALRCVPPLTVKVLPALSELLSEHVGVGDIRDVSDSDLLGRHQVVTDLTTVAAYLRGKRVLVTGAGGSIGSELCRHLHRFSPAALLMLDRDESALHAVQLSMEGRALLDSPSLILADIRDDEELHRIFERHRPEVVFHAAALKHLTMLERHPGEALKSNVWGTLNVLEASFRHGVERFVNISTDKAANPSSMLGYSKRIAERLTAHMAATVSAGTYLSVRFGNVLGSRGSVLPVFHAQIDAGGPVTVTDREVTRFFMTVHEAVQLIVQAAAIGAPGEVLVLDMGEPVRIADVAQLLIEQSRKPVRIIFTGLRPGEKLHEELFGEGEVDSRPRHPMISHVPVPPLSPRLVDDLDPGVAAEKLGRQLSRLAVDLD